MRGTLYYINEGRLERSPADQEPIHILNLDQLVAVLLVHAAPVDYPHSLGLVLHVLAQPLPDPVVNLVHLLGCGSLAGADGPHWFVSQDDVVPVGNDGLDGLQLGLDYVDRLVALSLFEGFAEAVDNFKVVLQGGLDLVAEILVRLFEVGPALRVAQDDPLQVHVLELLGRDLAGIGPRPKLGAILGSNLHIGVLLGVLNSEQVQENGRHHHIYMRLQVPTLAGSNSSLSTTPSTIDLVWTSVLLHFQLPPKNSLRACILN